MKMRNSRTGSWSSPSTRGHGHGPVGKMPISRVATACKVPNTSPANDVTGKYLYTCRDDDNTCVTPSVARQRRRRRNLLVLLHAASGGSARRRPGEGVGGGGRRGSHPSPRACRSVSPSLNQSVIASRCHTCIVQARARAIEPT